MATPAETNDVEETLEEVSLHDNPSTEHGSNPYNGVANGGPEVPHSPPPLPSTPNKAQPQTPKRLPSLNINGHSNTHVPASLQTPPPRISTSSSAAASVLQTRTLTTSFLTLAQGQTLSVVLITSALDTIIQSKEAKRSQHLRDATEHALNMLRHGLGADKPREIFEPLRLACETKNDKLQIASLDCIAKLTAYAFFVEATPHANAYASPPGSPSASATNLPTSLADIVTHTVTNCYTESTPDTVSLQIVKALLALVLSPHILVHHSSLLKAVRTVYNIFLLSQDSMNQNIAQGSLTQMVHHIFARCQLSTDPIGPADVPTSASRSSLTPSNEDLGTPISNSHTNDIHQSGSSTSVDSDLAAAAAVPLPSEGDDDENLDNEAPNTASVSDSGRNPPNREPHEFSTHDMFIKDAFLVFRSLCKLTMKPLATESERDLKSHPMRSKLLSLHLVLTILNSHMAVFVSPNAVILSASSNESTLFIQAIKQYLCLSLSRNAVSSVPQVFEASIEIFWRVLSGMRTRLKKEIEVLFNEIFIPILEMRTSTLKQKIVLLNVLQRLCQDPQALVEIYLNYDCDREAIENIYERLMAIFSKISSAHQVISKSNAAAEQSQTPTTPAPSTPGRPSLPPSLTTSALAETTAPDAHLSEARLRRLALESLVEVLRSLVAWGIVARQSQQTADLEVTASNSQLQSRASIHEDPNQRLDASESMLDRLSPVPGGSIDLRRNTSDLAIAVDDPSRFESAKQRKTILLEGIRKFNFKPKRGIQSLIDAGFIASSQPSDIAAFLLHTEGLNKSTIGEYLGEGEDLNIAVMHAFVDQLDFTNLPFVDALRLFLQSFRLPGEAQKIDRFMLKFADRYVAGNADTPFANATTAYVLAYSTIMLNTDQHSPQVKKRMTKEEFIKNNRGINDEGDLPKELLSAIYDDIQTNEIVMKDEIEAKAGLTQQTTTGLGSVLVNVGRDFQKEAYVMQSNGMANRTEALFKTMLRAQRKGKASDQFFSASHFVHVRPMFEVAWMSFLAGISGPMQESDNIEIVETCMDGFRNSIRIACVFDLELERNAFATTLAKFTFLNNWGEMKAKNMEAVRALLDVGLQNGEWLKGSWKDVLMCVSQLEHMQVIGAGTDLHDKKGRSKKYPAEELAAESRSRHITVAADMIFSWSKNLSGTAIVHYVQALSDVSWEEIQSSGQSDNPRLFSVRKLVEVCAYNMERIRIEWVSMWVIIGEHFNQVCCHSNIHVSNFALDALRQLAMRFLEKEELPSFKFQKDFLKPFEHAMIHNANPEARDMVLQCLQQMIQARVHNLRSGWRTMFGVFAAASKSLNEEIANHAFEIVTKVNKEHFDSIVHQGSFADLTVCITHFCKVTKYQRISLVASSMLKGLIQQMLDSPECGLKGVRPEQVAKPDDPMIKYWFPMLFSFFDIIMNGDDLEVRRMALDTFFNTLKTRGQEFTPDFWDLICKELIFPIFAVLKSGPQDMSRFNTQEDMSVWISTTMIQALRDVIALWTHHFAILERFLDGLLDLLRTFICQENDTLARIGTSCLQQLLQNNARQLSPADWERVITTFVWLFKTTTPYQLFDESLRAEIEQGEQADIQDQTDAALLPAPLSPPVQPGPTSAGHAPSNRKRIFALIITKCVLQLLLIETTHEMLQNEDVYETIPPEHLLRLMSVLDASYQFARSFNADKEVRNGLWRVGFMRHPPNLLKQESSSAATLVNVLLRLSSDKRPNNAGTRLQASDRLIQLGLMILDDFNKLKPDMQGRNISAWTPVVAEVLQGFSIFDVTIFARYLPALYPLTCDLLLKDISPEIRIALRSVFLRVNPC